MQFFDNGSGFTVTVTAREVYAFSRRWPCSGLRDKPVTFSYGPVLTEADGTPYHADLVDSNDQERHPNADGGAVLALCEDAMRYGLQRWAAKHPGQTPQGPPYAYTS